MRRNAVHTLINDTPCPWTVRAGLILLVISLLQYHATLFAKAMFAGPSLLDDFARGDGPPGYSPDGLFKYVQIDRPSAKSNVRKAIIVGQALVAPRFEDGQKLVATYTGVDFGRVPRSVKATIAFSEGMPGGAVAIICNENGLASVDDITGAGERRHGAFHLVFSNSRTYIGYFDRGILVTVMDFSYKALNGSGFKVGIDIVNYNTFKIQFPNGDEKVVSNLEIGSHLGKYVTFEHYYDLIQAHSSISRVEIN